MSRANYYDKQRAKTNVAAELDLRGWQLYDYRPYQSGGVGDDYGTLASWTGIATHPNHVGIVLCVGVESHHVSEKSGKPKQVTRYQDGPVCPECNGTKIASGELTLEQAKADPANSHTNKLDIARGFRTRDLLTGKPPIYEIHYHKDGSPKCLHCGGNGNLTESRLETEFTWPTFQANAINRFWHLEKDGKLITSGTGQGECSSWTSTQPIKKLVDAVESALAGPTAASTTPTATTPSTSTDTTASRDGLTVSVEHTSVEGKGSTWTWLDIQPRIGHTEYQRFAQVFGAAWSKKRRKVYIPRRVEAMAILDYLKPIQAASEPMETAQDVPEPVVSAPVLVVPTPAPTPTLTPTPAPALVVPTPVAPAPALMLPTPTPAPTPAAKKVSSSKAKAQVNAMQLSMF